MRNFSRSSASQLRLPFDLYAIANDWHTTNSDGLLPVLAGWSVLHCEIVFRSRNVVLVRSVIYNLLCVGKSIRRAWRCQTPLQRGALPWIRFCYWTFTHAPEQIHKKNN